MNPDRILEALHNGRLDLQGQFIPGSNYTFLGNLLYEGLEIPVVYKPQRGEQPLWDFPYRTLCRREAAAWVVSQALGWNLVPPTVFRKKLPLGPGSLQQFIEHDPRYHYFRFSFQDRQRLRPAVMFDLLVNNADRKGGHILKDAHGALWLIDHGLCFHVEDKLRTVLWEFEGGPLPENLAEDVRRLETDLSARGVCFEALKPLLRVSEIKAIARRARLLLAEGRFPPPPAERRAFPYPPI